jgi:hypothetical protein
MHGAHCLIDVLDIVISVKFMKLDTSKIKPNSSEEEEIKKHEEEERSINTVVII